MQKQSWVGVKLERNFYSNCKFIRCSTPS